MRLVLLALHCSNHPTNNFTKPSATPPSKRIKSSANPSGRVLEYITWGISGLKKVAIALLLPQEDKLSISLQANSSDMPLKSPDMSLPGRFPDEAVTSPSEPSSASKFTSSFFQPTKSSLNRFTIRSAHTTPNRTPSQNHVRQPAQRERNVWESMDIEMDRLSLHSRVKGGNYQAASRSSYRNPTGALRPTSSQGRPTNADHRARRKTTQGSTPRKTRGLPTLPTEEKKKAPRNHTDYDKHFGPVLLEQYRLRASQYPIKKLPRKPAHPGMEATWIWNEAQTLAIDQQIEEEQENLPTPRPTPGGRDLSDGHRRSQKLERHQREQEEKKQEEDLIDGLLNKFHFHLDDLTREFQKQKEEQKEEESKEQERKAKEEERRKQAQAKRPKIPFIHPPTKEQFAAVPSTQIMARSPSHEVIGGRNPISYGDLLKILPEPGFGGKSAWLNDNAVNGFFAALCEAARGKLVEQRKASGNPITDTVPRYHNFLSQWYPKMTSKKGYDDVKMWAKRAKLPGALLLKVYKLFIPLHLGNHWALLVINPQNRTLTVFDSMVSRPLMEEIWQIARDYLRNELGDAWIEDEWTDVDGQSAQQANGSDCGVFASFNGLGILYGDPTDLIPNRLDLIDARKMMAAILVNGGFKGEFDLEQYYSSLTVDVDGE